MYWLRRWLGVVLVMHLAETNVPDCDVEEKARNYLKYMDKAVCEYLNRLQLVNWAYETNVTAETLQNLEDFNDHGNHVKVISFPWLEFSDPEMKLQALRYNLLTPEYVFDESYNTSKELQEVIHDMTEIFDSQRVCYYKNRTNCTLSRNPELANIFGNSDDPEELKYYWLTYHNQLGLAIKEDYSEYVKLGNKYAQFFNYSNKADQWIAENEGPPPKEFEEQIQNVYLQLEPLYLQIHAFVRKQLFELYGPTVINRTGPLPIHLTGTTTGEDFQGIIDKVTPYPKKTSTDVTEELIKQNYTVKKLAEVCDDFYQSLGLPPMPETFYNNSQFEKPKDRNSTCFTTAWDMYDGKDYRLLTCVAVNMDALLGLCHEMGHLQYSLGYKNLPCCYHLGLNNGLDEGWADVAGLSVGTTKHLSKLGLIEKSNTADPEVRINQLFFLALDKVARLPYASVMELWRYRYFRGDITDDNCNTKWWELRLQYQGMTPPETRSDDYLDPTDKSHIVHDSPYIMYFLAYIIQFQIQQSLCSAACEFDPANPKAVTLDKCDIYGSKEAGKLIKDMLSLGSSKPWPDALEAITGQRYLDARPIVNYFSELYDWLKEDNERTGEVIGW